MLRNPNIMEDDPVKKFLTPSQRESIVKKIYDAFMDMPDMGLGESAEAREKAEDLVDEWEQECVASSAKAD